ncbi:MAG: hypothetical protein KME48_16795 [Candidatus Thiodiazotropha sp. (ex Ctena orbiculata)]|nr:hypothetical protein [Candidatus Thiodiazotropha taylori]
MEEAAVQYFRTGKLPDEWQGIQSSDYYYIVDEEKGLIKFDKSDDFYLLLKSTLIRYGVDIDVDNTLDHLNDIEFIFFDEIESALIERRGHKTQMNIDDAYIHALSAKDSNSASRLLELIFERDRRGLSVIKSN